MAYHPFRNLGLKFLSICIAALLWLVVAGERVVERVMRAPVEMQNLPDGLELVGNPPDTVEVRLRGPSGALSRMAAGDMAAVIDLRTARPGRRLFHLTQDNVIGAVRHGDRAGRAVDADDGIRDVGRADGSGGARCGRAAGARLRSDQGDERSRDGGSGGTGDGAETAAGGDHRAGVGAGSDANACAKW